MKATGHEQVNESYGKLEEKSNEAAVNDVGPPQQLCNVPEGCTTEKARSNGFHYRLQNLFADEQSYGTERPLELAQTPTASVNSQRFRNASS